MPHSAIMSGWISGRGVAFAALAILAMLVLAGWDCQRRWRKDTHGNFARQLLEREESERKRVALAIQDGLGHQLLALKTLAGQTLDHPGADSALRAQLERLSALVSESLQTARVIAYRLRPFELDQLGLAPAIHALVAEVCQGADLRIFKVLDSIPDDWPTTKGMHLFRLVQESLRNVIRHAHASTLLLEIKPEGDRLAIQIEDDGVGFDATAMSKRPNGGLGLPRMREHVKALGGELTLTSSPGRGSKVRVVIPLRAGPE